MKIFLLVIICLPFSFAQLNNGKKDYYYYKSLGARDARLVLPLNNSVDVKPNNLTMRWAPLTGGGLPKYEIQISTDNIFGTVLLNESGMNRVTYLASGLSQNTIYYWRIRAVNNNSISNWTDAWNFRTRIEVPAQVLSGENFIVLKESEGKILMVLKLQTFALTDINGLNLLDINSNKLITSEIQE